MSNRKTIIVLEHCWDDDARPVNKDISVLPYIDGVCRLNNYELFYGKYIGPTGFDEWVERFRTILSDKDRRIVLYLAGHGTNRTLAGKRIGTLLRHIFDSAQVLNIEGCILGGCFAGQNTEDFKVWMATCSVTWIVGYRYAVDWLPSTLCDVSLIGKSLSRSDAVLRSRPELEDLLRSSTSIFNPSELIAEDINGVRQSFSNTLSCVIQPRRQGQRPVEIDIF